jgi:Protein of unknown function (DUF1186)
METNEILAHLDYGTGALDTEALLQALEEIAADNELPLPEKYPAYLEAIRILAELSETEAHIPLLQLCLLPEKRLIALFGNVLDFELDRALAATAGGSTSGITLLVEDPDVCEDVRISGLRALVLLAASGDVEREEIIECLDGLFSDLERTPSLLWEELVSCACQLAAIELLEDARSAWLDGLIEGDWQEIKRLLKRSWKKPRYFAAEQIAA